MLEILQSIDESIFFFINHGLQNRFLDWLMPIYTDKYNWFPLFALIYILLWWKGGRKGRVAAILIIPVILLSDQISSSLLKPWIGRTRPCVALEDVHMLIGLKTSFSFPSSHAANSFAAATFFAHFYPGGQYTYFFLAGLSAFSRVYVGVHYPFDVLAGAILGVVVAWTVIYVFQYAMRVYTEYTQRKAIT